MQITGVTIDVFVSSSATWAFWAQLLDRRPDLMPDSTTAEWKLSPEPEIALRVRVDADRAGAGRVGLGVDDLVATKQDLEQRLGHLADITTKPHVIATLELQDPSGNRITLWQDLLQSEPPTRPNDHGSPRARAKGNLK
jgi:catechol 2,3-dioxygenase-like lactoylglutathione lyase family enzyme